MKCSLRGYPFPTLITPVKILSYFSNKHIKDENKLKKNKTNDICFFYLMQIQLQKKNSCADVFRHRVYCSLLVVYTSTFTSWSDTTNKKGNVHTGFLSALTFIDSMMKVLPSLCEVGCPHKTAPAYILGKSSRSSFSKACVAGLCKCLNTQRRLARWLMIWLTPVDSLPLFKI